MRQFYITTPYQNRYYIHDNGDIERTDIKGFEPSGQWKFIALARTKGFAWGKRAGVTLADLADGKAETVYKNRAPRYTIIDLDHGTQRIWGNDRVHGVASVRRVREDEL